jgi:methylmalonyl-CoA carboxyltransferase 5S subunit
MPKTPLQMLLRGQNLLGYRHYGDDIVERFVEKAADNGMDVFRVFDALNDPRNLRTAIKAVRQTGKHAQGTICYTISPEHTIGAFVDLAEQLLEMGCDSICVKDMAGLLKPQPAYELVRAIKQHCGAETLVHVHVHSTTGVTLVSLMKAIEAGADMVDTAVSSMSLGPGHNPTESLIQMLEGTGFYTEIDKERFRRVNEHFRQVKPRYSKFLSEFAVETEIFESQIPGGMISNMESQLKQQGAGDRVRDVLLEVPQVRKDAGYPPLVTPTSQIVGTQAVFNVLMGKYKVLSGEFADLMLGYYGETIGVKNQQIVDAASAQSKKPVITRRPADLIPPEWDRMRSETLNIPGSDGTDEDVLTYAMFPQVAPKFFATRKDGPKNLSKEAPAPAKAATETAAKPNGQVPVPSQSTLQAPINYTVTINGHSHRVTVAPQK